MGDRMHSRLQAMVGMGLLALTVQASAQELRWQPAPVTLHPPVAADSAASPITLGRPEPVLEFDMQSGPASPPSHRHITLSAPRPVVRGQMPDSIPPPPPPPPPPVVGTPIPVAGVPRPGEEPYNCGVCNTKADQGFFSNLWEGIQDCWQDMSGPAGAAANARCWASGEYLYWQIQDAPVAVPLITANSDSSTIAALNDPGTIILFGQGSGQSTDFDWFSGLRATAGGWINQECSCGLEGSGFLLERRSIFFSASSAGGTAPIVSIPFNATEPFNFNPAGETSLNAGNAPNTISAALSSRLWGLEANVVCRFLKNDRCQIIGLIGVRYLDLMENLTLDDVFFDTATGGVVLATDAFGTRNQFYAGQVGIKGEVRFGRFYLEAIAKAALGVNHQTMNISGTTTVTAGAFGFPSGGTAGAVFAQPSNIGRFGRNEFAVVPEVQLKLGYQVTPNIRPFISYNFLYLSDALRPGNQLNRNINPTQNAFFVPPGTLVGTATPLPAFNSSTFWAQGVSLGVEVRW